VAGLAEAVPMHSDCGQKGATEETPLCCVSCSCIDSTQISRVWLWFPFPGTHPFSPD